MRSSLHCDVVVREAADDVLEAARAIIAALEEAKRSQDNATAALQEAKSNFTEAEAHLSVVRRPVSAFITSHYCINYAPIDFHRLQLNSIVWCC